MTNLFLSVRWYQQVCCPCHQRHLQGSLSTLSLLSTPSENWKYHNFKISLFIVVITFIEKYKIFASKFSNPFIVLFIYDSRKIRNYLDQQSIRRSHLNDSNFPSLKPRSHCYVISIDVKKYTLSQSSISLLIFLGVLPLFFWRKAPIRLQLLFQNTSFFNTSFSIKLYLQFPLYYLSYFYVN